MKSKILRLGREDDGAITATITVPLPLADGIRALIGCDASVEVKKWRERRSLTANGLLWVVCDEIADAIKSTKVEVYRRAILEVGVFQPLPIRDDAVDAFCANWESGGVGWVAEKTDRSRTKGYTLIHAYFGSSTYDSKEFSRLVAHLLTDAKEAGITLKAGAELEQKARELGL